MADLLFYRSTPDEPLDCLYVATAEGKNPLKELALPTKERDAIAKVVEQLGAQGVAGEVVVTASPVAAFKRIACFGIGDRDSFTVLALRRLLRRVLEQAGRNHEYQIAVALPYPPRDVAEEDARSQALVELALADYRFDRFRSRPDEATKIDGVHVVRLAKEDEKELQGQLATVQRVDTLVRSARDLGNRPANDLTPSVFAAELKEAFQGSPVRVTLMPRKELEKEGLRGIIGVGSGSAEEPLMVRLEYRAKKPRKAAVFIGKGVTFDAGGISLKPSRDMHEMKYDMAGAAAVVAAMHAVAEDQPPLKVVGLLPLVENLPSGTAIKPGDILRLASGATVEVTDTDAEGRLIVADSLAYSARFSPDVIVDLATLTAAAESTFGNEIAALFSNNDELAEQLVRLGRRTGDRVWRLPMLAEYKELLRSDWADLKNDAGRVGALPSSAAFLQHFVPDGVAWAHLDIAGVAWLRKGREGLPVGATGFGVRILLALLEELAENA